MRQDPARFCPLTTHHDVTARNDVVLQSDWTATIVAERIDGSLMLESPDYFFRMREIGRLCQTNTTAAYLACVVLCQCACAEIGHTSRAVSSPSNTG